MQKPSGCYGHNFLSQFLSLSHSDLTKDFHKYQTVNCVIYIESMSMSVSVSFHIFCVCVFSTPESKMSMSMSNVFSQFFTTQHKIK